MNTQPEGECHGVQSKSLILIKLPQFPQKDETVAINHINRPKNALEILTMTPHPDVIIICVCVCVCVCTFAAVLPSVVKCN